MKRMLLSALMGTAAFVPGAASAQSPECDRLVLMIEQSQGAQLPIDIERARVLQTERNEAECVAMIQQVEQQGAEQQAQQPAQPGAAAESEDANATPEAQEGAQPGQEGTQPGQEGTGANIVVQQPAPTVTVDQAAPQITVQQPQPTVTVRQPQPEIIVRQPAPVVTIDIPQPEIIVRMAQPEVQVQQAQPTVQVSQPQPEVRVEQPEQPQVQVQEAAPPQVQLTQPEGQANVQVESTGEPTVTYERAEPQVTINQAEGQPTIRMEEMAGQAPDPGQAPAAGQDSQDPNQTPEAMEGQAADQAAQQPAADAALPDSGDPNQTPAVTEGQQQQAAATEAGQQPATAGQGEMQRMALADFDGLDVINERGEQLGDVAGIVQSAADQKQYVVIEHGGFLGLGEKRVALSLEGLMMQGDRLIVPGLSDDEIRALPVFEDSDQYPEVDDAEVEIRTMVQQ